MTARTNLRTHPILFVPQSMLCGFFGDLCNDQGRICRAPHPKVHPAALFLQIVWIVGYQFPFDPDIRTHEVILS